MLAALRWAWRVLALGTRPEREMEGQAGRIIFSSFFTLKIFLFLQRVPIIWLLMGPEADISLGAKLELSFCFQGCLQTSKETDLVHFKRHFKPFNFEMPSSAHLGLCRA